MYVCMYAFMHACTYLWMDGCMYKCMFRFNYALNDCINLPAKLGFTVQTVHKGDGDFPDSKVMLSGTDDHLHLEHVPLTCIMKIK